MGATIGAVASVVGSVAGLTGIASTAAGAGARIAAQAQASASARRQAVILARQAEMAGVQAEGETLLGRAQATHVRRELSRTLAAQNVRFASAGLLAGEGSSAALAAETARVAESEIGMIAANARMARATRMMDQATLLSRREEGLRAARAGTLITMLDVADRVFQRVPGIVTSLTPAQPATTPATAPATAPATLPAPGGR